MITVRAGRERGLTHFDWLDSRHTFSFDRYYDPRHMGFRNLRVINEDRVQPGKGFPTHGHRDMEILTVVLEGVLEHQDSLGNGSVISPGQVQRMSAGAGIHHSEWNPSRSEPVHLLQIWILPERLCLEPNYEQRSFPREETRGLLRLIAAPDGRAGAVIVHQDVELYRASLRPGEQLTHPLKPGRHAWAQVAQGVVRVNDIRLKSGDGAAISQEANLTLTADDPEAEVLLFDLA